MKNVLLATDFSRNSRNAIDYALKLYQEELDHVNFTLIHSFKVDDYLEDSRFTPIPSEVVLKKRRRSAQEKLKRLIEHLKIDPSYANVKFRSVTVNKSVVKAVQEQIEKDHTHLLVIGTRGHSDSSGVPYGSHTLNLLEEVENCPVLAVPSNIKFKNIEEIVLANSFKTELRSGDLNFLVSLARKLDASIRILHISEEGGLSPLQKKHSHLLKQKLIDVPHSFHFLEVPSIPLGIYSFTESRGSGVIAFINKKHNFIENIFFDPVYKNLAHYSRVPLLVLHQP